MSELNVRELQQLKFEIEGKVVNQDGVRTVLVDGVLKAKELSQKQKIALRTLSKDIETIINIVADEEKEIYNKHVDGYGTKEARIKESSSEEALREELQGLYAVTHTVKKVEGLTTDIIENITGTQDFYEQLLKLQN